MAVKTEAKGSGAIKVGIVDTKVSLTALRVVFDTENESFLKGDTVWVRSVNFTQGWAKEVYQLGDHQFILIPESVIEAFHRG
jgi:hypothetical protein